MPLNKSSLGCGAETPIPPFKIESDIAGKGVIVSFAASAWITVILIVLHYFSTGGTGTNPIDVGVMKWLQKKIHNAASLLKIPYNFEDQKFGTKWRIALEASIMTFSDTQIFTGIAILVSGHIQLKADINLTHWQMMVSLAWFSSLTHIATLTVLRGHFRQRPYLTIIRVIGMTVNLGLLLAAMIPTGYGSQDYITPMPAKCLYRFANTANTDRRDDLAMNWPLIPYNYLGIDNKLNETNFSGLTMEDVPGTIPFNTPVIMVSWAVLLTNQFVKVIRLFYGSATLAEQLFRVRPSGWAAKRYHQWMESSRLGSGYQRIKFSVSAYLLRLLYLMIKCIEDVFGSVLYEIIWLVFTLIWGTLRLLDTRGNLLHQSKSPAELTTWGFGQVLPVCLLVAPFYSLWSSLYLQNSHNGPLPTVISQYPASEQADSSLTERHKSNQSTFCLDIYNTRWTQWLVYFIFQTFIMTAISVLYVFYIRSDDLTRSWKHIPPRFVIIWACFLLILFAYTAVCLKYDRVFNKRCQLSRPHLRWSATLALGLLVFAIWNVNIALHVTFGIAS